MKAPTQEHIKKHNAKSVLVLLDFFHFIMSCRDRSVVPVVLDPILSRRMRDHQKDG